MRQLLAEGDTGKCRWTAVLGKMTSRAMPFQRPHVLSSKRDGANLACHRTCVFGGETCNELEHRRLACLLRADPRAACSARPPCGS